MESTRVTARGAAAGKDGGHRQRQGYRQRQRHRNSEAGYNNQFSGWSTTFFFYNFPEELEAKFLWNSFQMYGKVVDVYLPRKRDKRGKRFGFVRMIGVNNEMQMERRLNGIWIGSYKIRVKIANDQQRKPSMSRKIQGEVKDSGSTVNMNRLIQPGHSYAQAVKGQGKRTEKAPVNLQERNEEATPDKEGVSTRAQENKIVEKGEETMEFIPTGEEMQWLEGGMVAEVRSMATVSEIQEQLDVDGGSISLAPIGGKRLLLTERVKGYLAEYMKLNEELCGLWFESLKPWEKATEEKSRMVWLRIAGVPLKAWSERCFRMIGETIGEVLMIHDDTKKKSILWDGRVLILCPDSSKISKRTKLRVEEQVYEIEIVEEEWRSDPDWWLSENDRKSDLETESEYSVAWSQNVDPELDTDGIGDGDEMSTDSEQLMKDLDLNSNSKPLAKNESCGKIETGMALEGNEGHGLTQDNGPQRLCCVGPVTNDGPAEKMDQGQLKEMSMRLNNKGTMDTPALQKSGQKTEGKKQRPLQECYPETMEEIWAKGTPWVTPRSNRDRQGEGAIGKPGMTRVLQREMSLLEVRRMMRVGKRLGFQFDNNEEEIQAKLLEAEDRLVEGRRDESGRKEVKKMVKEERPDFLFLQETKLERMDVDTCRQLWNSDEFDWVAKDSSGASGGLLCLWDRRHFVKREELIGDGFVGISGEWGISKQQCFLVNVYGPNDRQKRAKLWEELRKMKTDKEGYWLIAGDFNAVRGPEERRGKLRESPGMKDFDEFIVATDLVDVKLTNRRYTWYKPDGTARSRLNRFLLSTEMSNMEGEWIQQALPRNISDHCAVVLKSRTTDWGPRPFRVLDAWQQHPEFKKVVEEKWSEMEVEGFAGYKCQQKLKLLKEFLKGWNKEVFGNMEALYGQAVKKVEQVDMQNEVSDLEEAEIVKRQEGFSEMWDCIRKRELIWKQKSRDKWVREGDANTRFFHRVAIGRRAHNNIVGVMSEGGWCEEPDAVKNEVAKYFSKCFQGDSWNRPKPGELNFQQISEEKKEWLERPFSVEEIEEGLRSCDGSKAPGPDGFNFNFLKFAWHCIKEDFINFFSEFHRNGKLVRGLNSSFIALIPKKLNAVELKDFRPISLIGCVYKLLAKVLANRLKSVISELVSDTQSAFVGGRQLVDSVLVLNEVVDEVKKRKKPAFVFKADFEKAYDCVDWSFLDWMMERCGFGTKWRGWITECLSTARISVLVNGSPTREFEVGKGLRQGDPLSPFLFLLIAEGLQGLVQRAVTEGMLHGIEVGKKGMSVSLLQFADDTIIMGRADAENIRMIVLAEMIRIQRCFLWGGTGLNKKISWVKWDYVCSAKAKGGLGVPDLRRKNWAMLGKWWYRMGDGVDSLWKRVVREKYYGGRREVDITAIECARTSKLWGDIIRIGGQSWKHRNMLAEGFKWEVGEGNKVAFWHEWWVGDKNLRDLFPRLFELSMKKEGKVAEMGFWEEGKWVWRVEWRRGTIGREKNEEEMLEKMLEGVHLKEGVGDVWKWVHEIEGKYVVKIAYDLLASTECVLEDQMCKLIWCRWVPSKVAFFGWRLCLNRLPTKENLQKRGIQLQVGAFCDCCNENVEEVNHLFCVCYKTWLLWTQVLCWWGVESVLPNTVVGMTDFFLGGLGRIVGKEMGSCIFLVVAWYLWYRRNAQVFRKDEGLIENLLERVQVKTFLWIKSKVNGCVFSFHEWQTRPMECAMAVKNHKRMRKQFYKTFGSPG
ncbi:hypothetical protein SLEP1_g57759 [Rubroshorea leprosula]|uniref:Reverse transcriptase domain-containing protein n=1 Tax=Rubroshorea leprosula TaxID=152421 RepID=A0AAV5MM43_9ROSI|nr:hypothetical protein SLEP1_g57759 [Rubroshorea leprosula]